MPERKILLLTQHFQPTKASGGRLLSQLMPRLVGDSLAINVLTSNLAGGVPREEYEGVTVRRLSVGNNRRGVISRGLVEVWFAFRAALWFIFHKRPDMVIVHSSPPFLPYIIAPICRLRNIPYLYILYDLYPDFLALLGRMNERSLAYRAWDWVSKLTLKWARITIIEGRCVQRHLGEKFGRDLDSLRIVHNWSERDVIFPLPRSENHYFKTSVLPADKFIVQYSGNIGRYQDFDVILRAAEILRDEEDILFFIVGSGNDAARVDAKIAKMDQSNICRLPFQDESLKNDLLNAADVSLITLVEGMEKIGVPSKIFPTLAAGVPVLSVMNAECEVPYILAEENVGCNITDRSGRVLAQKILALKEGTKEFSDPRAVYLRRFDIDMAVTHYNSLIIEILEDSPQQEAPRQDAPPS